MCTRPGDGTTASAPERVAFRVIAGPVETSAATASEPDDARAGRASRRRTRESARRLAAHARGRLREPRWIVLGIGASLGWTLAKIAIPLFALQAIDDGIDPYDGGARSRSGRSAIVVLTLFTGTFTYFRRTAAFAISLRAEAELRRRLFDHLQRLHFGYHDRAQIGELMARVSTDAKQVQMLLVFIPIAGANFVMVLGVADRAVRARTRSSRSSRSRRCRSCSSPRPGSRRCCTRSRWACRSGWPASRTSSRRACRASGSSRASVPRRCRTSTSTVAADGVYDRGMAMARLRGRLQPAARSAADARARRHPLRRRPRGDRRQPQRRPR